MTAFVFCLTAREGGEIAPAKPAEKMLASRQDVFAGKLNLFFLCDIHWETLTCKPQLFWSTSLSYCNYISIDIPIEELDCWEVAIQSLAECMLKQ